MRNRKRSTDRQTWSEMSMARAIEAVLDHNSPLKTAARNYNVPRSTLRRRVTLYREFTDLEIATMKGMGSRQTVFSPVQEAELAEYLKAQEARLEGLTSQELRILAFQMVEKNGMRHPFKNGMAGEDWMQAFFKRVGTLSLRKPESVSAARAAQFNKVIVNNFFGLLSEQYKLNDIIGVSSGSERFPPNRIFNLDETGCSTNAKTLQKIIGEKGKRQVGKRVSSDRAKTITAELCISASGEFLPPAFIFPRQNMRASLLSGGLEGSWGMANPSGWITSELFFEYVKWFISIVKPTAVSPVLLIVDGHISHKSLEVLEYARENHLVMICIPPHCTHRLQPLDVGVMKPLSTYYAKELDDWSRKNPGKVVTEDLICSLLGKALEKAATPQTIINAFRKTGIYPFNPEIFTDTDYAPAIVTEISKPPSSENSESEEYEVLEKTLSTLSIENPELRFSSEDAEPTSSSPSVQVHHHHITPPLQNANREAFDEPEPIAHCSAVSPTRRPRREAHFRPAIIDSSDSESSDHGLQKQTNIIGKTFVQRARQNQPLKISPTEILPLAMANPDRPRKRGRPRGKTAVLTGPQFRHELKNKQEEAQRKEKEKRMKKQKREIKMSSMKNASRKKKTIESDD